MIGFYLALQVVPCRAASEPSTDGPKPSRLEKKKARVADGQWLPIPIFLTEPAFGYGLGVALGYFHPVADDDATQDEPSVHTLESVSSERGSQKPPPTITGVAGGYTEKDTWAVAVAHATSWRQDTIRYAGGLAYADVNSEYYISDRPFDFNLKGSALYQDLKFRLGNSRFLMGGKLLFLQTESQPDEEVGQDTGIELDTDSRNIGVAAALSFDGRDNVFTPNRGQLFQFDVWRYDEGFGGDYNYWTGQLKMLSFHQLYPDVVLGLRLEASAVDGMAPFYAYPWIDLRGIPAFRYQGKSVGMLETEIRWNILPRWSILGFAGAGDVGGDDPAFETGDNIYAGGVGARYFMMRDLGLWLGVDVARGPEDWYGYITVGHAW